MTMHLQLLRSCPDRSASSALSVQMSGESGARLLDPRHALGSDLELSSLTGFSTRPSGPAEKIQKVEGKIDYVEDEIREVKAALAGKPEGFLVTLSEAELKTRLAQLQEEKNKLQEEKNILLRQQEAARAGTAGADPLPGPNERLRELHHLLRGASAASSRLCVLRLLE